MKIDLYLPVQTWKMIDKYGDDDFVINQILSFATKYNLNLYNKPPAPSKNAILYSHRIINITDPDYLLELASHPVNSPVTSLRRIIFWFFDAEMYDEYPLICQENLPQYNAIKEILCNISKNLERLHDYIVTDEQKCYYISVTRQIEKFKKLF